MYKNLITLLTSAYIHLVTVLKDIRWHISGAFKSDIRWFSTHYHIRYRNNQDKNNCLTDLMYTSLEVENFNPDELTD